MIKKSLITAVLLFTCKGVNADTIKESFTNAKTSGELKSFYISRSYDWGKGFSKDVSSYTRDGLSVGGHLNYNTASYYGFDVGATFYTTNKVDPNSDKVYENDPTLFKVDGGGYPEGYTILGESYINYKFAKSKISFGRLSINTPFAAPNNFRMLPNTFEGLVLRSGDVKDFFFELGHITKIQTNGFANSVPVKDGVLNPDSSLTRLSLLYGFGPGYKVGEFEDISKVYLGQNSHKKSAGMTYAHVKYTGIKGLNISVWDQYIYDIMNIVTARVSYKAKISDIKTFASLFYTKESSVGDNLLGEAFADADGNKDVDSTQYGAMFKAGFSNGLGLDLRYVNTPASEGSVLDGGIINALGGANPYIISQGALHANFGDTSSYMAGVDFQSKPLTGVDLLSMIKYFKYDIGEYNGYFSGHSWTTDEIDLDFIYKVNKDFKLRARANFPKDWLDLGGEKTLSFSEYRLIAYYNF